jgi:ATP-dependent Clp protease ATP-binding subunit ClpC
MVAGFSGIVARAKDLAQKRRQVLSTAHVLCAAIQDDTDIAQLCAASGLTELHMLGVAAQSYEERQNAIDLAAERAQKQASVHGVTATRLHLLLAIIRDPRSAGALGLTHVGVDPHRLAAHLLGHMRATTNVPQAVTVAAPRPEAAQLPATRTARMPRARARRDRERGFLSAALATQTEQKLQRRMGGAPLTVAAAPSEIRPQAPQARTESSLPLVAAKHSRPMVPPSVPRAGASTPSAALDPQAFPLLTALGRNLTLAAQQDQIDPVVGRDAEIEMLLDVLARRRGNNPVLVGAPGVGKTAVVEGLALALATRPAGGAQTVLVEVSASSLLAGTGVRGALAERLQTLRAEVKKSEGRVLLFIDEIHTVIGTGEGDSLGNELKTALARGELPVVGATTDAEYRRVFERDAALARRFTRIEVAEPSASDAIRILEGLVPRYEAHHGVRYEPAALSAAVELSVRYLCERKLPDKAIALLDQAGARVRRRAERIVDLHAVASVVSELASVPVERLLMRDAEALLTLESHLAQRVVGQGAAVSAIASALRKSAAGFRGQRPLGTFLFLGPTGVGKTEMAKAICERVFPGASITRIDMSELGQAHAAARLFGAPPGYIGHDEGGQLTEAVRHRPYQLILLDEIEKAHMDVLLSLLPLLDEGRLTDGRGRTVDFTNTVIVMTSNLGADSAVARARIGFGDGNVEPVANDSDKTRALAAARAALPPELWNRIDEPLYFNPLCERDVVAIAMRLLGDVAKVARERHGVVLDIDPSASAVLVAAGGFDRALGARPMRRTVSRLVEAPLAEALLSHELVEGSRVLLRGDGKRLEFVPSDQVVNAAE